MILFFKLIFLIVLFFLLGKSADWAVENIKKISQKKGVSLAVLGIILGIFTTLPELGVGVNALFFNYSSLSLGNLLGGLVVIFCLILGLSAVLNKQIPTTGDFSKIFPVLIYIFLPFVFIFLGRLGFWEGLVLIGLYLVTILFLYKNNHHLHLNNEITSFKNGKKIGREIKLIVLGVIGVILFSDIIVRIVIDLLKQYSISPFLIGLLGFSIGTNLPEITITLQSWRKKAGELSINHLLGSAMANVFLVGVFAFLKPFVFTVDKSFVFLGIFILAVLVLFAIFYKTKKSFSWAEGMVFLFLYIIFILFQTVFAKVL